MKTGKRALAMLLCALLLVGVVPFCAFAQDNSESDVSIRSDGYDMNATNGLGRALMKTVAQGDNENETQGFSFSYCYVNNKTAYVGLNNATECTLVVSIYSEETGQMLGTGVKTIEANTFDTEVDIDIDTMPQYFVIRAFLLDENMASLCKPFTVIDYSKQYEEFDKKTTDDFSDSIIVNFDEQKDDNFAVLSDGAIDDSGNSNNTLLSYDSETGKYVFDNIDNTIKLLKPGDCFYKD